MLLNFENFKTNEAFGSQMFKKMNLTKSNIAELSSTIDFGNAKDSDVLHVSKENITKKDYKKNIILVCGEYTSLNQKYDYSKDDSPENPHHFKHYGLLYLVDGTRVRVYNGRSVRKGGRKSKSQPPTRTDVLTSDNYDFFVVKSKEPHALRTQRNASKENAFVTQTGRHDNTGQMTSKAWRDETVLAANKKRYAALKSKLNFDHIFDEIDKKRQALNSESDVIYEFFRMYAKHKDPAGAKLIASGTLERLLRCDQETVKKVYDFHYIDKDKSHSKMDVLQTFAMGIAEKLNEKSWDEAKTLELIKSAGDVVKNMKETDLSEYQKFIDDQKWKESDKLKGVNDKGGIFEN